MSEEITSDLDRKVANLVRLAQQLAEAKRWRDQRILAAENEALRSEQYRLRSMVETARPYLSEGLRDRWWNEASLEDAVHMLGVSERFKDVDPMAGQVRLRARREIAARWDVDVEEPDWRVALTASDAELAQAEPVVEGETPTEPTQLRGDVLELGGAEDPGEVISSIEANTSLPARVRDGLLARLQNADVASWQDDEARRAEERVGHAQAERDRAVADEEQAGGRVRSGEASAEGELLRAQVVRAAAEDTLAAARGRAGQARTGNREADVGIEAREQSFPVPAERALSGRGARTRVRRPWGQKKSRTVGKTR